VEKREKGWLCAAFKVCSEKRKKKKRTDMEREI
jgi:hypothetical protein